MPVYRPFALTVTKCGHCTDRHQQHRESLHLLKQLTAHPITRAERIDNSTTADWRFCVREREEICRCPVRVRFPAFQHFACEGGRKFAEEEPPRFMRALETRRPETFHVESGGCKQTGGRANGGPDDCLRLADPGTAPSRRCSRPIFQVFRMARAMRTGRKDRSPRVSQIEWRHPLRYAPSAPLLQASLQGG